MHTDRSRSLVGDPAMSWEEMRSEKVADVHTEHLTLPERVAPTEDLVAVARQIAAASAAPSEADRAICALVHSEVTYVSGSTTVDALGAHAWAERSGVCQDMAAIASAPFARSATRPGSGTSRMFVDVQVTRRSSPPPAPGA